MLESAIYIVATPIGNLSDITLRAIEVLKSVDLIAAEDTRHSRHLLGHYGISTKLISLHEHNEDDRAGMIVDKVKSGASVALISDAGTPLISDPGYVLVARAREMSVNVVPVPGVSACITALCASGMASDKFVFDGFLPVKENAKRQRLESLQESVRTLVFYESPRRILDTLEACLEVFGDRYACVARELTKRFETFHRARLSELIALMQADHNQLKGEFVLMVSGMQVEKVMNIEPDARKLLQLLLSEMPPKRASAIVAEMYGCSKKELYQLSLDMK